MMGSDVNAIIIFGSNGFYPSETLEGDTGSETKILALDIKLRFAIARKCIGIMFMHCHGIDWFGAYIVRLSFFLLGVSLAFYLFSPNSFN